MSIYKPISSSDLIETCTESMKSNVHVEVLPYV